MEWFNKTYFLKFLILNHLWSKYLFLIKILTLYFIFWSESEAVTRVLKDGACWGPAFLEEMRHSPLQTKITFFK